MKKTSNEFLKESEITGVIYIQHQREINKVFMPIECFSHELLDLVSVKSLKNKEYTFEVFAMFMPFDNTNH